MPSSTLDASRVGLDAHDGEGSRPTTTSLYVGRTPEDDHLTASSESDEGFPSSEDFRNVSPRDYIEMNKCRQNMMEGQVIKRSMEHHLPMSRAPYSAAGFSGQSDFKIARSERSGQEGGVSSRSACNAASFESIVKSWCTCCMALKIPNFLTLFTMHRNK